MATPGNSHPNSGSQNPRRTPNSNPSAGKRNNQSNADSDSSRPEAVRPATAKKNPAAQNRQPSPMPTASQAGPQGRQPNAFPQSNYQPQQPFGNAAPQVPPFGQGGAVPRQVGQPVGSQVPLAPGQRQGDAGPAPVRVPGQGSTNQTYSEWTEQTIGSPVLVVEPASTMRRFYVRSGGMSGVLLFGILGVAIPGIILGFLGLAMAYGTNSVSAIVKGVLFCVFFFWVPTAILFGNYFLISKKMYLSVHQGGLFLRQAKFFFFNTTEITIPFNQIQAIRMGLVENTALKVSKQFMSNRKYNNIKELASANLNILTVTGQKIMVPGFADMFQTNSLKQFFQSVRHFMN